MSFCCSAILSLAFLANNAIPIEPVANDPARGEQQAKSKREGLAPSSRPPLAAPSPPVQAGRAPGNSKTGQASPTSLAEQISRLQRAILDGEERLARLKKEYDDPSSEYKEAKLAFEKENDELTARKKAIKAIDPSDKVALTRANEGLALLEKARNVAKNRFDLAIEDRKFMAEQITTLTLKLKRDREALDAIQGTNQPPASSDAVADPKPSTDVSAGSKASAPKEPSKAGGEAKVPAANVRKPAMNIEDHLGGEEPEPAVIPTSAGETPASGVALMRSKDLAAARQDAEAKAARSKAAEAEAKTVTERLESLDMDIALEKKLLETARKQRDNAEDARRESSEAFRTRSLAAAPKDELDKLVKAAREAETRHKNFTVEAQEHTVRLDDLQAERASLLADHVAALQEAEHAQAQATAADREINKLLNPFSPRNVLSWLTTHGPKIVLILLAMFLGQRISRLFSQRVIRLLAQDGARGSSVERENRARTLVGVFYNAVSVAITLGGGLMILQTAGFSIAPLLGGAAVLGLAVAFGAQSLIRDYFYGFVILLENQYKLNDVVKIGDLSGQVEKITLRMTVLRDLEGNVHFIPNGGAKAVTNMTHGWSRALFDISVSYKENVDKVMKLLLALASELRSDPEFSPLILEDATMLGVDDFRESAVSIKFYIKTRPLQQWTVRRELLRRIKNRFDEMSIEIPLPQRTVYHRLEANSGIPELLTPRGNSAEKSRIHSKG